MLNLKRKPNESIIIQTPTGESIHIKICESKGKGSQVNIGIDAPKDYLILREELIDEHELETTA